MGDAETDKNIEMWKIKRVSLTRQNPAKGTGGAYFLPNATEYGVLLPAPSAY